MRAVIDAYTAAMKKAAGDTTAMTKSAQGSFADLNKKVGELGSELTRKVTLPLVATGGGALKLATDFETSFGQMVGLAGVAGTEVAGLREQVLSLAHDTGVGPQKLADALYFVRSAGIDAAHSIDILNASAKASASGMGDPAVVARTLSAALNAYGAANLSAAHATDVLTAGIRAATFGPDELAGSLGLVIATASSMGVSFDQLVGDLAVLSRTGMSAEESTTALNAVFSTLLGTSKQGQEALASQGLSLEQLRDVAAGPGGVIQVMRMLDTAFHGNDEALSLIIPNVRAYRASMTFLAQDAGTVDEVMRSVTNSTGAASDAFAAMKGTDAFKIKQDWADLQVTLIKIGATLAPIAAQFGSALAAIVGGFDRLPKPMQEVVVWLAIIAAGVGPVMKAFGLFADVAGAAMDLVVKRLVSLRAELVASQLAGASYAQALGQAFTGMAASMATAAAAMLPPALLIAGIAMTIRDNAIAAQQAAQRQKVLADAIKDTGSAFDGLDKVLTSASDKITELNTAISYAGVTTARVSDAVLAGGEAWATMRARILAGGEAARLSTFDMMRLRAELENLPADLKVVSDAAAAAAANAEPLGLAASTLGSELDRLANPLNKAGLLASTFGSELASTTHEVEQFWTAFPPGETVVANAAAALAALDAEATIAANSIQRLSGYMDALFGATFGVGDAQQAFADSLSDVDSATVQTGGSTRNLEKDQRSLEKATKDVTKAQDDLKDAEQALADARKGPSTREKHDAALDVSDAQLALKDAQRSVADARKKVIEERKKGKAGDVAGANLDLQKAQNSLVRAQDRVTDAQAAQNKVLHSGEETSDKVKDAIDDVKAAQEKLTDATQAQTDAETTLAGGGGGGAVADHARAIRGAYDQMTTAGEAWIKKMVEQGKPTSDIITALDDQAVSVQKVIDKYGDANGKLGEYLDWLKKIRLLLLDDTFYTRFNVAAQAAGGASGNPIPNFLGSDASGDQPGLATGGKAEPFTTYEMGEDGPEALTLGATSAPDKLGKGRASAEMSGRSALGARTVMVGLNGPQLITMGAEGGWVTPNHKLGDVDGARAAGGPVEPGKTYLVGERGPEIVTVGGMLTSRHVASHDKSASTASSSAERNYLVDKGSVSKFERVSSNSTSASTSSHDSSTRSDSRISSEHAADRSEVSRTATVRDGTMNQRRAEPFASVGASASATRWAQPMTSAPSIATAPPPVVELTIVNHSDLNLVKTVNEVIRYSKQTGGLPIRIIKDL